MPRKAVSVYLPPDLEARVRRLAVDQHRSESGVITDILKARLERGDGVRPSGEIDARLVFRLDARLQKVVGEALIMKEIVLLFVRVWLEHTPPLDEHMEESAAASADARFERFCDLVAQALAPGQSLASRELRSHALAGAAPNFQSERLQQEQEAHS